MISTNKVFKLTPNQQSFLVYINPWWDKELNKLIKQQRGWLHRFGQQADNYFLPNNYTYDQYPQLIKNVNAFLNFYEVKTKAILKLPRAVSRFRRWFRQVEALKALMTGIIQLTQFYEINDQNAITSKRSYILQESNEFLRVQYHHYQNSLQSLMPRETHETLTQIFKNTAYQEDQFFNPMLVFKLIHQYLNRLLKLKKINEELFVNLWFKTISLALFFQNYIHFQERLLSNIIN